MIGLRTEPAAGRHLPHRSVGGTKPDCKRRSLRAHADIGSARASDADAPGSRETPTSCRRTMDY